MVDVVFNKSILYFFLWLMKLKAYCGYSPMLTWICKPMVATPNMLSFLWKKKPSYVNYGKPFVAESMAYVHWNASTLYVLLWWLFGSKFRTVALTFDNKIAFLCGNGSDSRNPESSG